MPYIWPQENGGRTDVTQAAVTAPSGRGLAFVCTANSAPSPAPAPPGAAPALQLFSASRHAWRELEAARHGHELAGADGADAAGAVVHVHLDAAHMGVGGDDSWSPSVHDAYLVKPGVYEFGVALLPT